MGRQIINNILMTDIKRFDGIDKHMLANPRFKNNYKQQVFVCLL